MKVIDCLGDICPLPVIRLKQALIRATSGDSFLLVTDHSCTPTSICEYCEKHGFDYSSNEVANGIWEISIKIPPEGMVF